MLPILTPFNPTQYPGYQQPAFASYLPFALRTSTAGLPAPYVVATGLDFDVSSLKPAEGTVYYVIPSGGSDLYGGTNDTTDALNTVNKAIQLGNALGTGTYTVKVKTGTYDKTKGGMVTKPTLNCSIIGYGGPVYLQGADASITWAQVADTTATYQATRSAVHNVFDTSLLTADGDWSRLTLNATYAAGELDAGTYGIIGSVVYVRTADSRAVTNASVKVSITAVLLQSDGAVTTYFEGLTCQGGYSTFGATAGAARPTMYAKNCVFSYCGSAASPQNGINIYATTVGLQGCTTFGNYLDGFNYHEKGVYTGNAFEVNCAGYRSGWSGSNANNGSTIHAGCQIVRVNGVYHDTNGPIIADVGAGTNSWNVGCSAYGSTATTAEALASYFSQCTGGAMWLDGCKADPAQTASWDIAANIGGIVYTHNFISRGKIYIDTASGAKLIPY